jgi:hypothetical protein
MWFDAQEGFAITEEESFVTTYVEKDLRDRGYDRWTLWQKLSERKYGLE